MRQSISLQCGGTCVQGFPSTSSYRMGMSLRARLLSVGPVVLLDSGSGPKYIHHKLIIEIAAAIDRRPV